MTTRYETRTVSENDDQVCYVRVAVWEGFQGSRQEEVIKTWTVKK